MKTDEQTTFKHLPQGLSPAVEPQTSSIITTDSVGIIASETTISSQGEQLPAYIARPANHDKPLPIILVVQEIFGVHLTHSGRLPQAGQTRLYGHCARAVFSSGRPQPL